ncbi:TPA: prolyl oligopeptidase family serine peptidase [Methanosarcina acetivorans]|uniref:Dienelactone hydrolase n=2 Tax=Methanosarcina acetivorans TaxID=2214 RepID=Q8TJ68_METAC|nr:alpha/beta fold hydrolase [Methanosarcina acetivorans]AAM07271.1 dienelactone hydrolase [Methanosarcina acetivorans C2A]HIH94381.1 prolyl oligopeptidase family serine peptidase [Methanosarcina acetivorans]
MKEKNISFYGEVKLSGVLRYPENGLEGECFPAVLLNHGTLEQDRDGNTLTHPDGRKVHSKNFFLEMSRHLCRAGIATFSWDKRGVGGSENGEKDSLSLVKDSRAALDALNAQDLIDANRIAVFGQSAGVYTTCLLAKDDTRPKAYILSGGLYRDCSEMIAFNYLRPVEYARKSPEQLKWVEENDLFGLVLGLNLSLRKEAMKAGKKEYTVAYKGKKWIIPLDTLFLNPDFAPRKQFRHISRPALVIHGEHDLNVPLEDAYMIESELRGRCFPIELVIIPGADHSFQKVPEDKEERLKERMSLDCFKRPYNEEYFRALVRFLSRYL